MRLHSQPQTLFIGPKTIVPYGAHKLYVIERDRKIIDNLFIEVTNHYKQFNLLVCVRKRHSEKDAEGRMEWAKRLFVT